ncbi:glycosyltransferase [Amycolatopsis alba]|uniref:Glycosyltransferase n=1 Tax=Amycolatopsis alba DSM 44262 TaxID=1125972 RepID=A0A229RX24_AMYAL|nr:glycosyltransferase [Amycolatopsis alba]OXM51200.1 glycosyltransferase [Amycolatopsis alba DSM 44262]
MPVLSVLTPVHPPSLPYLTEAYGSLVAQELPPGWTWEWVVQEDGETGLLDGVLPADERVLPGSGRRGGPGVARMLALSRASGDLIKALDADDLLAPGALARDIAALEDPAIGWTTCRVLDLFPDGTTAGVDSDPEEGPIERGAILRYWQRNGYVSSVVAGTLCIRRELLLDLGGWMALPASEDTGLVLAANASSDGYFLATCGMFYRKWDGQVTASAAHNDDAERLARMKLIEERAEVMLARGLQRAASASAVARQPSRALG